MKAKFGAIVVDGRGKLGGHVASRNRAGSYFRTKVTPVNPNTPFQQAARGLLTSLAQTWRTLTADERSAWNSAVEDFARTDIFGDIKNPTGFNLFVRLNTNIDNVNQSQITLPPLPAAVIESVASAASFIITGSVGTVTFSPTVTAGMAVLVRATPGLSAGISFVKSEFRIIDVMDAAEASPFDIFSAYVAKFGTPVIGGKIFVSLTTVNILTGQVSVPSQVDTIVVA